MSGFITLLCLVVLVGYRVAHGAVCKKLDFFLRLRNVILAQGRGKNLYTAVKVDRISEVVVRPLSACKVDVFYHQQRLR